MQFSLARFRGIKQRFLHLHVTRYEFLQNHGHLDWQQTFEAALHSIFSTTGRYLRRIVHQHRRIPLNSRIGNRMRFQARLDSWAKTDIIRCGVGRYGMSLMLAFR